MPERVPPDLRERIDACLRDAGDGSATASEVGRGYLDLGDAGRARFLRVLAEASQALESPRARSLKRLDLAPNGVSLVTQMRADLLREGEPDAALAALDRDLLEVLVSWFDAGALELRRITPDDTALVEKLVAAEEVHPIRSRKDLMNRLDPDRRCYAFFHPGMPETPLIFIEVALVRGLADSIETLLDETAPTLDPAEADTAIFYSMSSTQSGLEGIDFRGPLVGAVVAALTRTHPNLRTFSSLSRIPGFRGWLDARIDERDAGLLGEAQAQALVALAGAENGPAALGALLARPNWHVDDGVAQALRAPLMRNCARYLLRAKRADHGTAAPQAADPTAHFHCGNGARLERLNWLANSAPYDIAAAAGMLANYRYPLADLQANRAAYRATGAIAASPTIKALAEFGDSI